MSTLDEVRAVLASRQALTALRTGSAVLIHRGGTWIAADPWTRGGMCAGAVYVAVCEAIATPDALALTVPAAAAAWTLAAWTLAPALEPTNEPEDELLAEDQEPDPRGEFARWLLNLMGDRPGIHLRELYPAMRTLPGHEQHDDPTLRAALDTLGIPVRRSLRVGAVAGRSGVHHDDVAPLAPPRGERPGDDGGDAGQGADSPAGEYLESAVESG